MPASLLAGLVAGICAGVAVLLTEPVHPDAFFAAAVQVIPVFLVASALERSLSEMLGTESSLISEEHARVDREWTPPSSSTRRYYGIGLQLRGQRPVRFTWKEVSRYRQASQDLDDLQVSRELPEGEHLEEDELRELSVALASRALAGRPRRWRRWTPAVPAKELLQEWDDLFESAVQEGISNAKAELAFEIGERYKQRRVRRQRSVVASVIALVLAEALAFVGLLASAEVADALLAPGAAVAAAAVVAVTVDAVEGILAQRLDVQSAGLDVGTPNSGSHWDQL